MAKYEIIGINQASIKEGTSGKLEPLFDEHQQLDSNEKKIIMDELKASLLKDLRIAFLPVMFNQTKEGFKLPDNSKVDLEALINISEHRDKLYELCKEYNYYDRMQKADILNYILLKLDNYFYLRLMNYRSVPEISLEEAKLLYFLLRSYRSKIKLSGTTDSGIQINTTIDGSTIQPIMKYWNDHVMVSLSGGRLSEADNLPYFQIDQMEPYIKGLEAIVKKETMANSAKEGEFFYCVNFIMLNANIFEGSKKLKEYCFLYDLFVLADKSENLGRDTSGVIGKIKYDYVRNRLKAFSKNRNENLNKDWEKMYQRNYLDEIINFQNLKVESH